MSCSVARQYRVNGIAEALVFVVLCTLTACRSDLVNKQPTVRDRLAVELAEYEKIVRKISERPMDDRLAFEKMLADVTPKDLPNELWTGPCPFYNSTNCEKFRDKLSALAAADDRLSAFAGDGFVYQLDTATLKSIPNIKNFFLYLRWQKATIAFDMEEGREDQAKYRLGLLWTIRNGFQEIPDIFCIMVVSAFDTMINPLIIQYLSRFSENGLNELAAIFSQSKDQVPIYIDSLKVQAARVWVFWNSEEARCSDADFWGSEYTALTNFFGRDVFMDLVTPVVLEREEEIIRNEVAFIHRLEAWYANGAKGELDRLVISKDEAFKVYFLKRYIDDQRWRESILVAIDAEQRRRAKGSGESATVNFRDMVIELNPDYGCVTAALCKIPFP